MLASPVTLRCVHCGRYLVAPAPPLSGAVWFACPNCGRPVPVLHPRSPPPLFSWEAFPHLYPTVLPPRPPILEVERLLFGLLLSATLILGVIAGGLAFVGSASLVPGSFRIEGVVVAGSGTGSSLESPVAGASVVLTGENGQRLVSVSDGSGAFTFSSVNPGAVRLNVTASGYPPALVQLFVSAVYATVGTPGQPVRIVLSPGAPSPTAPSPPVPAFKDLETLVASSWSASILVGLGGVVAAAGTAATRRRGHPALGTAGGAAAFVAPIALFTLGVANAFPLAGWFGGLTMGIGVTSAGIQAARMASLGWAPDPD